MDDEEFEVPEGFRLVADETRARILHALSRQIRADPDDPGLGFAELRRRAGVRDSGNFNYHLQKLLGRFVEETPDGEGYVLTYTGLQVVATLVAGGHEASEPLGPEVLPEPCPLCGADLEVTHHDGLVSVDCTDDEEHGVAYPLPEHVVDAGRLEEAASLMARRVYAESVLLFEGRCPLCFGTLEGSLVDDGDTTAPTFQYSCDRCGSPYRMLVGMAAMHDPRVLAFYDDHGVDIRSSVAELIAFARPDRVERRDEDLLEVPVELDGDVLVATIDESATVRSVERH